MFYRYSTKAKKKKAEEQKKNIGTITFSPFVAMHKCTSLKVQYLLLSCWFLCARAALVAFDLMRFDFENNFIHKRRNLRCLARIFRPQNP